MSTSTLWPRAGSGTQFVRRSARSPSEINRILQLPDVRERFGAMGADVVGGTSKEFADHIQREIPKWAKVIRDANVKIE